MYRASIQVRLRSSILDPEGKTVHHALENLGYEAIQEVRMGKFAELTIDADSAELARSIAEESCEKLLANPVMEDYEIEIEELAESPA